MALVRSATLGRQIICWGRVNWWFRGRSFPCPTFKSHCSSWALYWSLRSTRIFSVKWKTLICLHNWGLWMQAPIMCSFMPLGIIGSVYWKSPPNATVMPPKRRSGWFIESLNVLSMASGTNLCYIDTSSYIISLVFLRSSPFEEFFLMIDTEFS